MNIKNQKIVFLINIQYKTIIDKTFQFQFYLIRYLKNQIKELKYIKFDISFFEILFIL